MRRTLTARNHYRYATSTTHAPPEAALRPLHSPGRLPIPAQPTAPGGLAHFNALPQADAEHALRTCCRSHAWARRVAAHRPYPNLDALLAAADEATYDLAPADITEALTGEDLALPPDPALYSGHSGYSAYGAANTALVAAHSAYQIRFGHPFVICLDDIAPGEALDHLLAGLRTRLGNDPVHERELAAEELRRLARGRLARMTLRETGRETGINSPYVPV
ncbi:MULTISPECIES: 2-oxo-4-hydroxy-4-carboxy-5-ureidoimidazoline decarboxylase [unclassified Streptomyces]|uniref:2-oxo-4-hydroxy-4-carboxy-5-ureidoimidazoline decarboxylase n=1 Tax=unclassified Streptomyces TaxID=2593676 RepID=UPI002E186C7E|nr:MULTISPECIES: 2-oxo-4-hydroxy-4-carboxy-5-ureidoimidazoline decarboxylase [unclassified Streptomyces]